MIAKEIAEAFDAIFEETTRKNNNHVPAIWGSTLESLFNHYRLFPPQIKDGDIQNGKFDSRRNHSERFIFTQLSEGKVLICECKNKGTLQYHRDDKNKEFFESIGLKRCVGVIDSAETIKRIFNK